MDFTKYFLENVKITKLEKESTNLFYVTDTGYIIKQYFNLVENNEVEISDLVKDFDVEVKAINKKVKITKFIKDSKTLLDEPLNIQKTIDIAHLISRLHTKKIKSNIIFNPRQIIKNWLKKVETPRHDWNKYMHFVDQAEAILPKKQDLVLCHNDLTAGNFLFAKDNLYLIDWEFASMNDPYFDIVSFLNGNQLNNSQYKEVFLKAYFKEETIDWDKIKIWTNFQNLMWGIWSDMMHHAKPDKIHIDFMDFTIKSLEKNL